MRGKSASTIERAGVRLEQAVGDGRLQLGEAPVAEDEVQEPLGGEADVGGRRASGRGPSATTASRRPSSKRRRSVPGVQVDDHLAGVADRGRPRQPVLQHRPHRGEGASRIGHADVEAVAARATAGQPGGGAAAGGMALRHEEPDAPARAVGVAPGPGLEVEEDGRRRGQPALARAPARRPRSWRCRSGASSVWATKPIGSRPAAVDRSTTRSSRPESEPGRWVSS